MRVTLEEPRRNSDSEESREQLAPKLPSFSCSMVIMKKWRISINLWPQRQDFQAVSWWQVKPTQEKSTLMLLPSWAASEQLPTRSVLILGKEVTNNIRIVQPILSKWHYLLIRVLVHGEELNLDWGCTCTTLLYIILDFLTIYKTRVSLVLKHHTTPVWIQAESRHFFLYFLWRDDRRK